MPDPANVPTAERGHGLLCPACKVDLVMSERQGIEIDYCPKCRGVWLDRGELDKIVERSQGQSREQGAPSQPYREQSVPDQSYPTGGGYGHHGSSHGGYGHYGKHGNRRRSWLSEIFD